MLFIDAGLWIAAFRKEDAYFERAKELLQDVEKEGDFLVSTETVFSEVITFFVRRHSSRVARQVAGLILSTPNVSLLATTKEECMLASTYLEKFDLSSYADALTMAVMTSRNIRKLLSFDSDFDRNQRIQRLF